MDLGTQVECPPLKSLEAILLESPSEPALSDTDREQIFHHLESCPKCQHRCESLLSQLAFDTHQTTTDHATIDRNVIGVVEIVKRRLETVDGFMESRLSSLKSYDEESLPDFGGEYEVIRKLGSGAQGVVYLARDIQLDRNVVIKTLLPNQLTTPEALERFKREAKSAARVRGEHIVPIYRISMLPGGHVFLVMEYVDGATLREYLRNREAPDFRILAKLARQIAVGLASVHEYNVVHRDVKPENILIDRQTGFARLADFGLAIDSAEENRITKVGTLAGTPAYMSPEQVVAPQSVDLRSDLYSLGVILYEMLTGDVPFRGTSRMTMMQVAHEEPRSPRSYNDLIPVDLETICLRAMAKDPAKRFSTALQFAGELERYLNGVPIESRPIGRLERSWSWVKRNPVTSLLVGTVGLLLVVVASISAFAAIRLSILHDRAKQSAMETARQRDAAFQTLEQLVYELQSRFDRQEVDMDEVQQNSLNIALRGMESLQRIAGSSPKQTLATAVALRHLGQSFHNLEQEDSARACLVKSDSLLRELLSQQPNDPTILLAFADTVFAVEDCMVETDTEILVEKYEDLTRRYRIAYEQGPTRDLQVKFADALGRQAFCRLERGQLDRAEPLLVEAQDLLRPLRTRDLLEGSETLLMALVQIEEIYVELLMVQERKDELRNRSINALTLLTGLSQANQNLSAVLKCELSLFEALGCFEETMPNSIPTELAESYQSIKAKMLSGAVTDPWEFQQGTTTSAMLANQRIGLERFASARRFLDLRQKLCEERLSVVNDDVFAIVEIADTHVAFAGLDSERKGARARQSLHEHCHTALTYMERLVQLKEYKDIDWTSVDDALVYLLDDHSEEAASLRKAWAAKVQNWLDDPEIVTGADKGQVYNCGETVKEIGLEP